MVGNALPGCASRGYNAPGPYPINFFQANPFGPATPMRLLTDEASSKYDALQLQFRQRYGQGVSLTANYTYGKARTDRYAVSADRQQDYRTLRDKGLDWGPTAYDLRHIFQAYGTYELPFGKDRHFNIDNALLDQIVGGWSASGIVRIQTGRPFLLTSGRQTLNQQDAGVVLNGITVEELQKMVKVRPGPERQCLLPRRTADRRRRPRQPGVHRYPPPNPASRVSTSTSTAPGSGRSISGLAKTFRLGGQSRINFEALFINAFNHRNTIVGGTGGATFSIDSTTFGQSTAIAAIGARQIQFRLGFYF